MLSIITAELYKLAKRKNFIVLLLLSLWPLVYGLGVALHWDFIQIGAKLDLITFMTTMWTFLLILTIPLLQILYTSSFVLGGEIQGGQILLEINRGYSRKTLVISKYIVVVCSILFLYFVNFLTSFITYVLLISNSKYGYHPFWEHHSTNIQSLTVSLINLIFVIVLSSVAFYLSLRYSAIVSAFITFGIYLLCQLLTYIKVISIFVPGYFFIVADYKFTTELVCLHFIEYLSLCILLLYTTIKKFERMGF
ncbi:ABC transporter permease [Streptococcus merionis]|uniref:ABC-2 family transporter protein n=1 Tax=Streptococcus merionis TaxID=400065 RepID=A0A239T065_9STRE|nr:ABC transporter permease [Streptococcus merionis]SNU91110.1 ABC-2 family transporter protein [Streptococcus merionis]